MCGIFAIFNSTDNHDNHENQDNIINTIPDTIEGLKLLQHRGKDCCGIAYTQSNINRNIKEIKGKGLVSDVFLSKNIKTINSINSIQSNICIGHVKYNTNNNTYNNFIQPLSSNNNNNSISLAHNGNIPNIITYDSQYLLDFILNNYSNNSNNSNNSNIDDALIKLMNYFSVSYCLCIIFKDSLYVMRDRHGIRPLSLYIDSNSNSNLNDSKDKKDFVNHKKKSLSGLNRVYVSSETNAFKSIRDNIKNYDYRDNIREVMPGEIIKINNDGIRLIYTHPAARYGLCAFELFYFMNPDSFIYNNYVYDIRRLLGIKLAQKEKHILNKNKNKKRYLVTGVPQSGIISAQAYARYLSLDYFQIIEKNNNTNNGEDRTFILPNDTERIRACKKKFTYNKRLIKNRNIIIVDDTIVRGNVIKTIIDIFKQLGANEIHIRIPAPPVVNRCQLGIAIYNKNELLMNGKSIEAARFILGVNSLEFLETSELDMIPPESYKECFNEKNMVF